MALPEGISFHERAVGIDRDFGQLALGDTYRVGRSGGLERFQGGSELIPFYFDGKHILI
jgi:hypothetical protein